MIKTIVAIAAFTALSATSVAPAHAAFESMNGLGTYNALDSMNGFDSLNGLDTRNAFESLNGVVPSNARLSVFSIELPAAKR